MLPIKGDVLLHPHVRIKPNYCDTERGGALVGEVKKRSAVTLSLFARPHCELAEDRPQNTCGFKSITTHCRAARPKGGIKEEGLMKKNYPRSKSRSTMRQARTFVALGLFLATSIGFAALAPAQYNVQYNPQYNNPQYNPPPQYNPQPPVQQPGNLPGYQGNQTGCLYGQQFDPRQNRCVTAAAAMPSCPAGQQFDQSQNPLRLHAAGRSDGAGAAPRTVRRQRVLILSAEHRG
jgi:hypothetical protein